MRDRITSWPLILALPVLVAPGFSPAGPGSPKPAIRIEQAAPATMIVTEVTGPYWMARRTLTDVVAYMSEHRVSGPLVVRYASDPTGPDARALVSQVGFVATGVHEPEPPFRRVTRPAETVATMTIDASGSASFRSFRELREWAKDRGRDPAGPVVELYPQRSGRTNAQTIVLQMVLEGDVPSDLEDYSAKQRAPDTEIEPSTQRPEPANRQSEDDASDRQAGARVPKPASPKRPKPAIEQDDGRATLAELFESRRFEAVALRLMPLDQAIPPELSLWLGQIVFRVNAAAKGLERLYPSEADDVTVLASALKQRYAVASKVECIETAKTPASIRRRTMITDMDRLLARISIKAAGPAKAREELVHMLQQVQKELDLVRKRAPVIDSSKD